VKLLEYRSLREEDHKPGEVYKTEGGRFGFLDTEGDRHYYDEKPQAVAAAKGEKPKEETPKTPEEQRIEGNDKLTKDINSIMDNGYDYGEDIKKYTDKGVDMEHELKVFAKKKGYDSPDTMSKDEYGDFMFWLDHDYGKNGKKKPRKAPAPGKLSDDDKAQNKEIPKMYLDKYALQDPTMKSYLDNLDKENIDLHQELMNYAKKNKKELGQLNKDEKKKALFMLATDYKVKKKDAPKKEEPIEKYEPVKKEEPKKETPKEEPKKEEPKEEPKKETPKEDEVQKYEPVKPSSDLTPEVAKSNKRTSHLITQTLGPESGKVMDELSSKGVDVKSALNDYAKAVDSDPEDLSEDDYKDFVHFMRIKHKIKK
jgi:hypothetical protein